MEKITLIAQKRESFGKKLSALRSEGNLPAVVYGQNKQPEAVSINSHEFAKIYASAGHNTIVELKIDQNASDNVLIHDVATNALSGNLIHADFLRVNMNQAIRTTVPLHFVGTAPAVYQQEGTLLTNIEEVEVETLPAKLPQFIEIDISVLDTFEKSIHIRDIVAPDGVKILEEDEEMVAKVDPPRSEAEMDALNEDVVEEIPAEEGEPTDDSTGADAQTKDEKPSE